MSVTLIPDASRLAAPLIQVLTNAFNLAITTDSDSIISYSEPCRVEPITLVDSELGLYDGLPKILSATNNLFASYYIAAATRSLDIRSCYLLRSIDHLKPNRSVINAVGDFANNSMSANNISVNKEISKGITSMVGESLGGLNYLPRFTVMATEAIGEKKQNDVLPKGSDQKSIKEHVNRAANEFNKAVDEAVKAETRSLAVLGSKVTVKKSDVDYMDAVHLITGKVFSISAEYGGQLATVQMTVSLNTKLTRPANMVDILSVGGELRTFKERWHGWRSGELSFVKDIIMGSDLIDNELRVGIHDETGAWLAAREADAGNRLSAILTGKRSVGTASGIYVLHARTARRVEANIGGKLSDFATRQKLFKRIYGLLVIIVDPEAESVTVYHRGINKVNDLPISEYTKSRGKDGTDMTDIIKLFLNGSAPTL